MTNIFQDPFEIQDDTSCSLHQLSNYVTDSYIFLSNSDIISWCYLYFFMCFYFWIVYLVFFLYKSEYAFILYHADDDAGQQYYWSPTADESAESDDIDIDIDIDNDDDIDKESKDAVNELYDNGDSNKCNNLPITLSTPELKDLNTKHLEYTISDNAKLVMLYDFYTKSFWYYTNQQSLVDFDTLEIIALQYVTKYNCMSIFNANANGLGYFGAAGVASAVASADGAVAGASADGAVISEGDINKNIKNITKVCEYSVSPHDLNILQYEYTPSPIHPEPTNTTTKTTTKSSVYASFKKNKRIEASDTDKSSLYTNHYRYMGKLLDYDEFNAYQAVTLKCSQACKQNTNDCLKYNDYKDNIDNVSKEPLIPPVEVHDGMAVLGCLCPKYIIKLRKHGVCQYCSPSVVDEPIVLDCSTNDTIPDHEKVD